MKMKHEEAPEVRQFSGKGKYISFIFISMLKSCLNCYLFWMRACMVVISCLTFHYSEEQEALVL